jgi:hypothetical protein
MTIDAIADSCLERKDKITDLGTKQKHSSLKYEGKDFALEE